MRFLRKYYIGVFFFISTIIGTLTHELGHYIIARLLGYQAKINYMATTWQNSNGTPIQYNHESKIDFILFDFGGPLATILLGSIGLVLLFIFKHKTKNELAYWSLLFLSLFWLRFPFNAIMHLVEYITYSKLPINSDEAKLGYMLDVNPWLPITLSALIGIAVALLVFIKFITKPNKLHFILWGLIAAPISYIVWFNGLGVLLLP